MEDKIFDSIVEEILNAIKGDNDNLSKKEEKVVAQSQNIEANSVNKLENDCVLPNDIENIIEFNIKDDNGINIDNACDLGAVFRMKAHTPARIGVGKAGARLKTATMLKLRLDHAKAKDSVFKDVDEEVLKATNLKTFSTVVKDKNEYLTRPDLGKKFDNATIEAIKAEAGCDNDVLIYASDGLSSTAINANVKNILPVLIEGLKQKGLKVAKPFYVKYGRVGAEDEICQATNSKVVCVLIGERPGLATAESMSAYICYKAYVGQPEARRTVVSNIHKGGTMAIEAGAYIVDVIKQILDAKASGVELKKQGDVI